MAAPVRYGRQRPTTSVVLPYTETNGQEAVDLYNASGRTAQPWQELLCFDILAVNEEDLWVHTKFGYEVPRRNGKNEVVTMRELYGLHNGERILHTAHRTTTSASAARRLASLLDAAGYQEVVRQKAGEKYNKHYTFTKQLGLEKIELLGEGGGSCSFRTRSSKGGLGEGFDLLVIDEAQEYQDSEESALKYVVSDSRNPQTIFCGTPPTPVSSGTVFMHLRNNALAGKTKNTGWAEWSVEHQTDPNDIDAWYETNPSLGTILTERKIADEIGDDVIDFNIQRLGLWLRYNLKSAISENEWKQLQCDCLPVFTGKLFVGIKFGFDGESVALSVAVKINGSDKVFVETVDCRPVRDGLDWIVAFLASAEYESVSIDGANGQDLVVKAMKDGGIKAKIILPTVKQIVLAHASFEQGLFSHSVQHMGQPALVQSATNCEKRAIGTGGGFGYRSILDGAKIELLESAVLAYWQCKDFKERKKQKVRY